MAASGAVPSGDDTVFSASTISLSVAGLITCRTICGAYCATTLPLRSTKRFTSIGCISQPPLAMALMAIAICSRVTATPCPIGICAMETLLQSLTGCKMPADLARQGNARALAKTEIPRIIVKPVVPQARCPILAAPMFDDLVMMLFGRQNSERLMVVQNPPAHTRNGRGRSQNVSVNRTTSSFNAPETTTILNVEPGSIMSVMTRSRSASASDAPGLLGSKLGSVAIARISPVLWTNDDASDADRGVFLHGIGQRGFDDVLNDGVNGQHHV